MQEFPKHLTVRMTADQRKQLQAIADQREVSVSDVVRELIANRLGE